MAKRRKVLSLKEEQAKWYKKLADSGFKDIEIGEDRLRSYSTDFARKDKHRNSVDTWQTKAEYYQIAEHFLNTHAFDNRIDRIIWEYHVNGISVRDIAKLLKKVKVNTDKSIVWRTVDRLTKIMRRLYINE